MKQHVSVRPSAWHDDRTLNEFDRRMLSSLDALYPKREPEPVAPKPKPAAPAWYEKKKRPSRARAIALVGALVSIGLVFVDSPYAQPVRDFVDPLLAQLAAAL